MMTDTASTLIQLNLKFIWNSEYFGGCFAWQMTEMIIKYLQIKILSIH